MTSFPRRDFLKWTVLASGGIFAAGGLGSYLAKKYNLSEEFGKGQVGAYPLAFTNKENGFAANFSVTALAKGAAPDQEILNKYFAIFFSPDGTVIKHEEIVQNSFREKICFLDQVEGWHSVILASTISDELTNMALVDATSSIRQTSPYGEDGHHINVIINADEVRSSNIFQSHHEGESRVIALFNAHFEATSTTLQLYDDLGISVFAKRLEWKPFETKYIQIGENQKFSPSNQVIVDIPEWLQKGLLLTFEGGQSNRIMTSSWLAQGGSNPSFTQSHGSTFPVKKLKASLHKNSESALLEKLSKATHLMEISEVKGLYPGDLICMGKSPFSGESWNSKILIPNPSSRSLNVGYIVSSSTGKIIFNSCQAGSLIEIRPNGFHEAIFPATPESSFGTVHCYLGADGSHNSLVKIVTTDSAGRKFFQHLRPQFNSFANSTLAAYQASTAGWLTDYWLGNVKMPEGGRIVLMIRNDDHKDEEQALLQTYGPDGLVYAKNLPVLNKKSFIFSEITAAMLEGATSLRIFAPSNKLAFCAFFQSQKDQWTVRHASGKFNRVPSYYDLKNWV